MFEKWRKFDDGETLDAKSLKILRAAAIADEESAERAADAPFLYARLRTKINAERQKHSELESWTALIGVMWRAAPAMILIAMFSVTMFWIAGVAAPQASDEPLVLDAPSSEVERIVFAERRVGAITGDEILDSILDKD